MQKYQDKGLAVLWIGHQDRLEKLNSYAEKNNITDYLFDPDDNVSAGFGITYGGGIVFVDRTGMVRMRIPTGVSSNRIETELKKIL